MAQAMDELQQKQIRQAEELLFSGPQKVGFCKELFFGRFFTDAIMPYPQLSAEQKAIGDKAVTEVREYLEEHLDAAEVDRNSDIPPEVIRGLADVGVLGMTIAPELGGRGLSQQNYCRVMEVIGGHCAATGVFVNAHHSIGVRGLDLFGTEEQKARWMKPMASGEVLAAFALTEPEAGSDASNVQTRATPDPERGGYVINGEKRYITNGAIAGVLTVMARTPDPDEPDGKVTAFLVTPDMPGFEVVEARMDKCGIRGTATARLAFKDMFVPAENMLGKEGKGLRLALTVLDFGRVTFGACCTGGAKACLEKATDYANRRRQFGKNIGQFELVKEKIAIAAADTFAMESAVYHTAALIDSDAEDYMLETAMLKVFASERLWTIVNDTLQLYGGAGYFTTEPLERMMRDARINQIGEGANDVLRSFIAMVGLRGVGMNLQEVQQAAKNPFTGAGKLWGFAASTTSRVWSTAQLPVPHARLQPAAKALGRQIVQFGRACQGLLMTHREAILDRQYHHGRIGDIGTELFMASCVYSRLVHLLSQNDPTTERDLQTGLLYLKIADRRNQARLAALNDNDDAAYTKVADAWMEQ
ncbi:Acyl-CoA dehydrogenase [Symmachiella dynata]|uniref:acyl-CoA dehydrogenase family protein n=1 Tax=Symmachiella dynata TaxID=2527995 RepID=UPI001187BB59|nr:acyl-CoA dehydrogenase family protein [Symmachiella dynata]QDT49285.1 Acyl-CoA dehydrogenase [Symmachiella dynata]